MIFPQVSRALTAGTLDALTTRFQQATPGSPPTRTGRLGGTTSLAQALYSLGPSLATGSLDLGRLLAGSSFTLPLTEADAPGTGFFRQPVLWGSGDYRALAGTETPGVAYDGSVLSGHLGLDIRPRTDLLTGLALSWGRGALDYTGPTGSPGTYTHTLLQLAPYVHWTTPGELDLWATAGYGWGALNLDRAATGRVTRDLTRQALAGGVQGPLMASDTLLPGGPTRLTLKAETAWTWATLAARGGLDGRIYQVSRHRLLLDGQQTRTMADGATLTPSLELGLRQDAGTGVTGTGLETGGGLRYTHPAARLTLELHARTLLTHRRDYAEWGVRGLVQLAPDPETGTGLALRLAPSWGQATSRVQQLWTQTPVGADPAPTPATGRVDLILNYGLWVPAIGGKVTPFTGMEFRDQGLSRLRVGLVLDRLGTWAGDLGVELTGEHLETAPGQPEQRIGVQLQFRFGGSGGAAFVPPVRKSRAH